MGGCCGECFMLLLFVYFSITYYMYIGWINQCCVVIWIFKKLLVSVFKYFKLKILLVMVLWKTIRTKEALVLFISIILNNPWSLWKDWCRIDHFYGELFDFFQLFQSCDYIPQNLDSFLKTMNLNLKNHLDYCKGSIHVSHTLHVLLCPQIVFDFIIKIVSYALFQRMATLLFLIFFFFCFLK
jgi:hypothetical protein